MPVKFLDALDRKGMPSFVTQQGELHLRRKLQGAGYVDARCFPEERTGDQFAESPSVTPLGWRVLDIVARAGVPPTGR